MSEIFVVCRMALMKSIFKNAEEEEGLRRSREAFVFYKARAACASALQPAPIPPQSETDCPNPPHSLFQTAPLPPQSVTDCPHFLGGF